MGDNSSNFERGPVYVAFFDLDDTLLSVNSGRVLVREAYRIGLMSTKNLLVGLYLSVLYKLNLAHSTKVIEKMALWLKGLEEKKLEELSQSICDKYLFKQISEEMLSEIKIHRGKNAKIVLLSAALPYICGPISKYLQMDDLICSTLQVENGILSGLPDGPLVFGPEKKLQVEAYCKKLIDVVGEDGGFILSSGCTVPANSKFENLKAMVNTAKTYYPHK